MRGLRPRSPPTMINTRPRIRSRVSPRDWTCDDHAAEMSARQSSRIVDVLIVVACVAGALLLRVMPGYHHIFQGARVVFASNDPWIHMRNVDNVAAHWPFSSWFDPYRLAPEGQVT